MRIFIKSAFLFVSVFTLACSGCKESKDDSLTTGGAVPKPRTYWAKTADTAQTALMQ